MNDGDYDYLGLEVGSGGEIIEFRTLSTRQSSSSSSPGVGQVLEIGHFTEQNYESQKFKCVILRLWQLFVELNSWF